MKLIEIIADQGSADTVAGVAEKAKARDFRLGFVGEDGRQAMRMLVTDDRVQDALDVLQTVLGAQPYARILVIPVEAALPKPPENDPTQRDSAEASREALYAAVEKSARFDVNFVVLVVLSTVVAAIGLVEDNVAVVIGAMVIAPLLGPNLALGLGTALGDTRLMRQSLQTMAGGIVLAVALSLVIGYAWAFEQNSAELLARTDVGLDSIALALASGAAAALSLSTGLSGTLVGVMIAVALLPPAATIGLMLGRGDWDLATGAALLLAANVVCVNLTAKLVFLLKGVRPRTWLEKERAQQGMIAYLIGWLVALAILVLVIVGRQTF